VAVWGGRYSPSRRSHKRLLSHRWTVQAYPGDGGDDVNAPKITFAETRGLGVRCLLIHCADYHCSHSVRLSDIEPR
jgi:hypothetical protein